MPPKPRSLAERFWKKVKVLGLFDCWLWTGSGKPYGHINAGGRFGKMLLAHRVSYELHIGPIPDDLFVLHKCDNCLCVNPWHLFLGTHEDNMADMRRKRRAARIHRSRKLDYEKAARIRARLMQGETQQSVAEDYDVLQCTVSRVGSGEYWS